MHHDTFSRIAEEFSVIRRDLHAHPELAFDEYRTRDVVIAQLQQLERFGLRIHTEFGKTGVVGVLQRGDGPMIGLRADMDALPMQEGNSFAHRSKLDGKMHACGHDGHTAMLLAAARYLAEFGKFAGTVCFIFQPAEEGGGGARVMLEDGLLETLPIENFYGLHNWPGLPAGQIAVHDGPVMAAADEFEISIEGKGAHGAMPHLGHDPIIAGTALVQALQSIVSRNTNPLEASVISVTRFHAGSAYNVIPRAALLGGTARALKPAVQDANEDAMQRICNGIAATHNVNVHLRYARGYPATINDAEVARSCAEVVRSSFGDAALLTGLPPSMGAEDFAYFAQRRPSCYIWLGNGPGEGGCTLHSPTYDFNDSVLATGLRYWVALTESRLPV